MKLKLLFFLLGFTSIAIAQNPNDCVNAITICGDSSLGIDPDGIGFDEFSLPGNEVPPCYYFDQHTIWFKFIIVESGTFTFDLIPDNGEDDYDFAIYGPSVTCTTLGASIRCSSTNPQEAGVPAATGLNMDETDTEEGPGEDGNGYLMYIDATAGDTYYLLVDRAVGSGPLSLFYTGTAKLPAPVVANQAENMVNCETDTNPDGFTDFNLELQTSAIIGLQTDATVTYHESLNDASIGINPLTSPYTNTENPQTIFARIQRTNGCTDLTTFTIEVGSPELMNPEDVVFCNYTSTVLYVLDSIIPEVIPDPEGYVFSYHNSEDDANNNVNAIGRSIELTETPNTIYVRVTDENDPLCFAVTSFEGYINRIKLATAPEGFVECDDDFDGQITVNLQDMDLEIRNGLSANDFQINYYTSIEDRLNGTNPISGSFRNTENPQTIYVNMLETDSGCFDYTQFNIVVNPLPIPTFSQDLYYYCLNADEPLEISVQGGFHYYTWNTGEEGVNLNKILVDTPGNYNVTVTNYYGCENNVSVEVLPSNIATITGIKVIDFSGFNNSIEIIVEGPGDYEYALGSNVYYQDSNIFKGLKNGYYTVYVRDKRGCGVVSQQVLVLDYPRYFTPNSDNYHDYWQFIGMNEFPDAKIYIFDRFGKLLKQISPTSKGWDGTNLKGKPLPSSDYWFTIDIKDRPQYRGHFTLKR
ncbi:T9SS type B sorting domain-containing protein [Aequorivita capsosiphonis]|uniref:T9SS type B sorting domain-containing protein n=1 Tax=Aequorivita capsosiphonis TaxID=487317 RepID=UPI00042A5BD4|nr:T9SS type B sorting domain-containing protein [Aequorivita capsosiphonis]